MSVTFLPKSVGPGSGVLSVSDEYRSQSVALSGTGVAPPGVSISPINTLSFAPVGVGIQSVSQAVTVTNNGGEPLTMQQIGVTGDFEIVPGGSCGGSGTVLPVGSACTMNIVFLPSAGGPRSGVLSVMDNAPNSPQAIQLTGTGVDFGLSADGSTTATVATGKNVVFPLLLTSVAGVPGAATLSCTGLPANAACVFSPSASVALVNAATTVSVSVNTGLSASASIPQDGGEGRRSRQGRSAFWLAALLPVGMLGMSRGRRAASRLVCLGLLGCVLLSTGCGAARIIPAPGTGSGTAETSITPAGTYAVTVSAASAGLVRSIQLTLTVQ